MYLASVCPSGHCMNWSSNHNFSVLLMYKVLEKLALHKGGPRHAGGTRHAVLISQFILCTSPIIH